MNYEEITMVNKDLKSVKVNGKPYVMVNDRVQGFRKLMPMGIIKTELITYQPDDYCVMVCHVMDEDGNLLATGHAQESASNDNKVNNYSMLENCETSAVGRALGFCGIGSVDSIASADEMQKFINAGMSKTIGEERAAELVHDLMAAGRSPDKVCEWNNVETMSDLTFEQYDNVVKRYLKK